MDQNSAAQMKQSKMQAASPDTSGYAAPVQELSRRNDIRSVGCVVLFMINAHDFHWCLISVYDFAVIDQFMQTVVDQGKIDII